MLRLPIYRYNFIWVCDVSNADFRVQSVAISSLSKELEDTSDSVRVLEELNAKNTARILGSKRSPLVHSFVMDTLSLSLNCFDQITSHGAPVSPLDCLSPIRK